MNENDPINVEYSTIIANLSEEELEAFNKAEFAAEVEIVARIFAKASDYYAQQFDIYVVTAALHAVWADYESLTLEAEGEE